jgi:probable addiction module antidote protein
MKESFRVYDPVAYLKTDKDISAFIDAALETGDPSFVTEALGVAARAKGMTRVARDAGLTPHSLYKSLRKGGKPEFSTVMRLMTAFDLTLVAKTQKKVVKKHKRTVTKNPATGRYNRSTEHHTAHADMKVKARRRA